MTPGPLKQVRWKLKMHARDAEWNPGDYAMQLWFGRIQTAPQATSSWRRCGSRFSRWSQSRAGFESVNLRQHPVRANRTSKMWLMWLRMISSFQRCTVLWEKSPLSVRKLCKNSCNGNYETPCTRESCWLLCGWVRHVTSCLTWGISSMPMYDRLGCVSFYQAWALSVNSEKKYPGIWF